MPDLRWRSLLLAGTCSGLVQVAAGIAMYTAGLYFAPWSGGVSRLLLAAGIIAGVRWYVVHVIDRRVTYSTALVAGVVIAVVTGLVYAAYNVVSVTFLYPGFLEDLAQARFAMGQGSSVDPARASDLLASLRAETTLSSVVVGNVRGMCLVGTAVSVLSAVGFRFAFPPRPSPRPGAVADMAGEEFRRS